LRNKLLYICLCFCFIGYPSFAAPDGAAKILPDYPSGVSSDTNQIPLLPSYQLRQLALHDAGRLYLSIGCGGFPPYRNYLGPRRDPETGEWLHSGWFPKDEYIYFFSATALWVGGIVNGDTLVSMAYDPQSPWLPAKFWPPDPESGGIVRSSCYADDEFTAVFTDTVTDTTYVGNYYIYDDTVQTPLGIKITQNSYSWRDTLYDDLVIIDYVIENIGVNFIREGWIGFCSDPDIYDTAWGYFDPRYMDDASGLLDTLLYDGDPDSRILVPYAFDWDGDPLDSNNWDPEKSARGAIAMYLLATSPDAPEQNFNWWDTHVYDSLEFGPRRVGTPEDPFRPFANGSLGQAQTQKDKYYLMSHPEIDYNELETDIHDSTDGWIPAPAPFLDRSHDTKFVYSFGPFDLLPGDTITFALAVIGVDNLHVNPGDFAEFFDPENPHVFQGKLDFTELMIDLRRADSVYKSAYTLPHPGPPQGLRMTDYDDAYVNLVWQPSHRPDVSGYYLNVKDTDSDDIWRHANVDPINDTGCTYQVIMPELEHFFAVSLIDEAGRESGYSQPVSIIPGLPHPPHSLEIRLDSLTPVLNWQPYCDTCLAVYMIYRSVWDETMDLYDSVSALEYHDYGAESGVKYNYMVAAKNSLQLESSPIGPVSAMPMALDKGVLFYDMNFDDAQAFDPYHRRYVDRLVHAIQPGISMDYHDIEGGDLSFKAMSHYTVIIFDSEKRGGKLLRANADSLGYYMTSGGKALFIVPNASGVDLSVSGPKLCEYAEGDFCHDILRLDSVIVNGIIIRENQLWGDLTGCRSLTPEYPALEVDSSKLIAAPIPVQGYIPLAGYLYPRDSVEILYRYQSMYPDSNFHEQINGIAYACETYQFVLFNFQLSLMTEPANTIAFRRALEYLGVDLTCGDVTGDNWLNVGDVVMLIDYLYRGGSPPEEYRADVNCDGAVDLADALAIINIIFREGPGLRCCR
jgi:hypothetical protein